ncbi:Hypothetical predicted protein [Prunus dulcis]|uniref:Uncharacterized protein n=1 Tax=Prunus dulcis TaxID=3755 RepID=A0A5E4G3T5_PRUDU|nr:hypothetical protein L3X38_009907 [Prunus dulcis]VVA34417.1 Hypothetical predicted protein [Prunus dulcis]
MERFQYSDAIYSLRKPMLCCARIVFELPSLQASQETTAGGIVNSYGLRSFSLQMFCLLLDSSVTPTMVLSSLQKELKPSIATFSR